MAVATMRLEAIAHGLHVPNFEHDRGVERQPAAAVAAPASRWVALEGSALDIAAVCSQATDGMDALRDLASGKVPAIILHGAVPEAKCRRVLRQMCEHGLYTPDWLPLFDKYVWPEPSQALPSQVTLAPHSDWSAVGRKGWRLDHPMADLGGWGAGGTVRTNSGHAPTSDGYFRWVRENHTNAMWSTLGVTAVMQTMYRALSSLSGGRQLAARAITGNGHLYGLCNIRSHKPGQIEGYRPHFDSLRYRERRVDHPDLFRHRTQLGGIVVLQSPAPQRQPRPHTDAYFYELPCGEQGRTATGQPAMQTPAGPLLCDTETQWESADHAGEPRFFYVQRESLEQLRARGAESSDADSTKAIRIRCAGVQLQQGDMYFFKSDSIHEVPGFDGNRARVVVGAFIGHTEDDPDIAVWS